MKPSHIVVLVIVLVVVFGASKLPDVAKYFGQSLKVLRKEMREFHDEDSAPAAKPSGSSAQEGQVPAGWKGAGRRPTPGEPDQDSLCISTAGNAT